MKDNVVKLLESINKPLTLIEINDSLELNSAEELNELQTAIDVLIKELKIYHTKKDKYILYKNLPGIKIGRVDITKKGHGFLVLKDEEDLRIDKKNLNGAIHNDLVECEVVVGRFDKEARVLRILERDLNNLVGEVVEGRNGLEIELDDAKKAINIKIDENELRKLVPGLKVLITIGNQRNDNNYEGHIAKVLGHINDPGVDIKSIAYRHGIFDEFSEEVLLDADNTPEEVPENDLKGRVDLSKKEIFTIDGNDTKDIDDAISLTKENDHFVLGVHIADVSYYVHEGSPLDLEAYERGTSSYLADTVIPMFPHKLSNGICSLNEGVNRLTLSVEVKIDYKGNILDSNIFESFICSKKKMTYDKVNDIIMRNIVDPEYEVYKETLINMNELAHILRKKRTTRGAMDFEIDEAKIIQDENGVAIDVKRRQREDGEKLIEEFMLIANETVATWIHNMDLPFLYRVHANPDDEKVDKFLNLIKLLGYKVENRTADHSSRNLQAILNSLSDKKEAPILASMLLRSMKKAVYQPLNVGHFGLCSEIYSHFTSPIRRYPDLTVHRLLRTYLFKKDLNMNTIRAWEGKLEEIGLHTSEKEQAAEKCERDVFDMKAAEYMMNHIGEEYTGLISGITNYGMFIQLDNLIEGLVHINSIKSDYFTYVEELLSLIGQNSKKMFRLGDEVKIRVINSNKDEALIDFELVEEQNGSKE